MATVHRCPHRTTPGRTRRRRRTGPRPRRPETCRPAHRRARAGARLPPLDAAYGQVVIFGGYGPLPAADGGAAAGDGGSLDDVRVLHLARPECRGPPEEDDKADRARKSLLPG
jgi:hypothetical protein